MSVKIFCDYCEKFIKNASKNDNAFEAAVCQECALKTSGAADDVEKAARRAVKQIQDVLSQFRAEVDRVQRRVFKSDDDK